VAEALACSLPVLISNKVNIWREVQSCGAGVVAADDLNGTCLLLQAWLEMSNGEKSEMRVRAYESFIQNFEIQAAANSLSDTLTTIVGTGVAHANV
jgi:hypothetical protein